MKTKYRVAFLAMLAVLVMTAQAAAHPDHGVGSKEMFPGEGVVVGDQHGLTEGHLPAVSQGVKLVGKAEVTNPSGAGNDGRVADVSAYGNYAFLTAFREPTCERAGAHVIDISDPKNPFEVTSAFMETTPFNYAGEGSQTLRLKNEFFDGVLFIHQNETCPGAPAPTEPRTRGGINIWDITDPEHPELLVKHAGDFTNPAGGMDQQANQTHSVFAWTNQFDGRTYAVLVDDEEFTDLDIMDITDPRNPVLVNDTLDHALAEVMDLVLRKADQLVGLPAGVHRPARSDVARDRALGMSHRRPLTRDMCPDRCPAPAPASAPAP